MKNKENGKSKANQYRSWAGKEIERKQKGKRNERKEGKEAGTEEQRKWKK